MKEGFHALRLIMSIDLWGKIKVASKKLETTATGFIKTAIIEKIKRDE